MRTLIGATALLALLALLPSAAAAHATLESDEVPANSFYRAVVKIPHGCDGSPTTAVRVQIPEGVIAVKPMPKAGWKLTVTEGDYQKAYDYYGTALTRGVKEVAWTGGSLPDAFYDEFIFRARLTDFAPGTVVYFPVVQQCAEGVHRWIEIPAAGENPDDYEEPAPSVTIVEGEHEH
jgi:periplasmic copper chaperone A